MADNGSIPSSKEVIELEGEVVQIGAGENFRVQVGKDHIVLAKLAGKMRKNRIKIVLGDTVRLEVSPYDATRGRITFRKK